MFQFKSANQRIEPMTRSAIALIFEADAIGALLVMAHPYRSAGHKMWPSNLGSARFHLCASVPLWFKNALFTTETRRHGDLQ